MGQIQQIPLTEGAYEARSVIANNQRCVNLYPEKNTEDSPFPWTLYPTPGLKRRFSPIAVGAGRAAYTASNGQLYYIAGSAVYSVASNFVGTKLGDIGTRSGPVGMGDNGSTVLIVDGTVNGFQINLATNVLTAYADPNYLGSNRVDYLDGFLLLNQPNTRNFYSTLLNSVTIDPTYVAARAAAPDLLQGVVVNSRQAYLLGQKTSEVWGNAGAAAFPFQAIPGAFIRHGIASIPSVALHDVAIYAVVQDPEGRGIVIAIEGFSAKKISTPAIEKAIQSYSTIVDAIGFTYAQSGHVFYVVTFPTGNATWVYDISTGKWHQRSWCDANGEEQRWRAQVGAYAYEMNFVADWENGDLYTLELEQYNDFDGPIVRRRSFPHAVTGGRQAVYEQFQAEMETGNELSSDVGGAAAVSMRFSPTRGKSWSQPSVQSLGDGGEYSLVPQWRGLGQSRDMIFELFWSADLKTSLNGAYCFITPTDA